MKIQHVISLCTVDECSCPLFPYLQMQMVHPNVTLYTSNLCRCYDIELIKGKHSVHYQDLRNKKTVLNREGEKNYFSEEELEVLLN